MWRASGLVVVLLVTGCGSDGGSGDLRASGTQRCVTTDGIVFESRFSSCTRAIERGVELAVSQGAAKQGFEEFAETAMGTACLTLQGDSEATTADRATVDLTRALDAEGVCPGEIGNLRYTG